MKSFIGIVKTHNRNIKVCNYPKGCLKVLDKTYLQNMTKAQNKLGIEANYKLDKGCIPNLQQTSKLKL